MSQPLKHTTMFSLLLSIMLLPLSGCQSASQQTLEAPDVVKNSQIEYIDERTWQVLGCQIEAEVDRTTLKTDGDVSHNTIRLAVKLPDPSQTYLEASLYGIGGVDLKVTGRRANWSLELPNTPYATAQMIAGRTYLLLSYTPAPTTYMPAPVEKILVVPLKDLPVALAEHEAACK